jgi:hypothetical protein
MDEHALHARQLPQPLIELDVRHHAAGQHEVLQPGLLQVVRDVTGGHDFQHVLVGGGDVNLGELRGEHPREVQVVAFANAEVARLDVEPGEQDLLQHQRIAVGRQSDNLPFVAARLEAEAGRHPFVERAGGMWELDAVETRDLPSAARAHAAGEPRPVAIQRDDERIVEAAGVASIRSVAEVMFDALEPAPQPELFEAAFELVMPLAMKNRGVVSPLFGGALGNVARDDAVAGEDSKGERLGDALPFHRAGGAVQQPLP